MNKKVGNKKRFNLIIIILIFAVFIVTPLIIKRFSNIDDDTVSYDINYGKNGNIMNDEISLGEIIDTQKDNDEVKIGIAKYQEFLWMIDGAFYNTKNDNAYEINGNKSDNLSFKCEYRGTNDKCYGINFEENYNNVFSEKVSINRVYGDGVSLRWYEKRDGEYIFRPPKNCDVGHMSTKQSLILKEKTSTQLTFIVYYDEIVKDGPFAGEHKYEKEFVLIREKGKWKVKKAYYHNPCYVEYNVE